MYRSRRRLLAVAVLAAVLVAGTAGANPADKPELMLFSTQARLDVDSSGQVVKVVADPALPAAVRDAIEATARRWRFAAPSLEGRPVAGVTYAMIDACAAPADGQYRLAVRYRGNGPAHDGQKFPVFPQKPLMRGDSALVKVEFRVMPDGTAVIDDMQFERGSKSYQGQYRQSIETWLMSGSYRPEQLDGRPVVTRLALPVEFVAGEKFKVNSKAESIALAKEQQRQRAARNESCEIAMGLRDKADRQVALDSPFKPLFTN